MLSIFVLELRRPLPIEPSSTLPFLFACTPLLGIGFFYKRVRPRENLAVMAITLVQVLLFSALGCVLQYLLAREGGAMCDTTLSSFDKAMGLDWLAYVRWVEAHAAVARVLGWAYAAMIPEVVALVIILGLAGRLDQLRTFMLAGMLCGAATILLSPLFPSVSSYVFLGIGQ